LRSGSTLAVTPHRRCGAAPIVDGIVIAEPPPPPFTATPARKETATAAALEHHQHTRELAAAAARRAAKGGGCARLIVGEASPRDASASCFTGEDLSDARELDIVVSLSTCSLTASER
jgi:hypothetical protein